MVLPMGLLLAQSALWYQARPLRVGEEAVVTLKLNGGTGSRWPEVRLEPSMAMQVTVGPVRVLSRREICWNIKALNRGYHRITFRVGDQVSDKELAVGERFMRVGRKRPGWRGMEILLHPCEEPFRPDSPVRSIEIDYPKSTSGPSGANAWMIYWFVVSMAAAWGFRRPFNVQL